MDFFRLALSVVVSVAVCGGLSTSVRADQVSTQIIDPAVEAAFQAAITARDNAVLSVSGANAKAVSQWALNTLVHEGVKALRENGDTSIANSYEADWNSRFSTYLTSIHAEDLGDHKPLSIWLANFYDKLEVRVGSNMLHQGLLGDIFDMNYAIPIVFAPKGDWRTTAVPNRDWVEYRKHFIPFANVITYWGSLIACNQIIANKAPGNDQLKKQCQKVAGYLRQAMGRYIAPKISDFVFNKANGISTKLDFTSDELVYLTAEDLLAEISQKGGLK